MLRAKLTVRGINPENITNKLILMLDNAWQRAEEYRKRRIRSQYQRLSDKFYVSRRYPHGKFQGKRK